MHACSLQGGPQRGTAALAMARAPLLAAGQAALLARGAPLSSAAVRPALPAAGQRGELDASLEVDTAMYMLILKLQCAAPALLHCGGP